jgi:hypothetical protein
MKEGTILPTAQWLETPKVRIPDHPFITDFAGQFVGIGSCFAQNLKAEIQRYGFEFWFNRDICAQR